MEGCSSARPNRSWLTRVTLLLFRYLWTPALWNCVWRSAEPDSEENGQKSCVWAMLPAGCLQRVEQVPVAAVGSGVGRAPIWEWSHTEWMIKGILRIIFIIMEVCFSSWSQLSSPTRISTCFCLSISQGSWSWGGSSSLSSSFSSSLCEPFYRTCLRIWLNFVPPSSVSWLMIAFILVYQYAAFASQQISLFWKVYSFY